MPPNIFENIRKINEHGQEYWLARDLQLALGYEKWQKFEWAIERAKQSCENSWQKAKDHFLGAGKMVPIGSGTEREISDYHLSRYACYLIAQNGDPRKVEIAKAQTYFAIKTREKEIDDLLIEDNKRVFLREEIKEHNKHLASAAKKAGVHNFGNFQDFGYMGLYGGLRQRDIKERKNLKEKEQILDHMSSEELAANLFRATQAEAKLKRENIQWEHRANKAHYEVGTKVRYTIEDLGGTMPEDLSTPEPISITKKRLKKEEKKLRK
jgi:DNA-damage-inducible protein D